MTTPSLGDQPREVRITTDGVIGRVEVDGTDLSRMLHGYTLEQRSGQAPVLVLYAQPHREGIVFDGMAHVAVADTDPRGAIVEFIENLDAEALENAAIHRDDLGGERYDLTRAMLRQITDWAKGGTS